MTKQPTMESRLIKLMRRKWVTPLVALREVGCFSLSQRCGELRRERGMVIRDKWVDLDGGSRVKAYRVA